MATWICKNNCYLEGYGCINAGTTIDVDEDAVTPRLEKNFARLEEKEAEAKKEQAELENDMTFKAKVQRLKELKVKIPQRPTKEVIDKLFAEHAEKTELPTIA